VEKRKAGVMKKDISDQLPQVKAVSDEIRTKSNFCVNEGPPAIRSKIWRKNANYAGDDEHFDGRRPRAHPKTFIP
jgi:hypothetical protein